MANTETKQTHTGFWWVKPKTNDTQSLDTDCRKILKPAQTEFIWFWKETSERLLQTQ
jgi:hypothetical protein